MMNDERDTAPDRRPPAAAKKAGSGKEDWIGAHLRRVYAEARNEPVPARFLSILKKNHQQARPSLPSRPAPTTSHAESSKWSTNFTPSPPPWVGNTPQTPN